MPIKIINQYQVAIDRRYWKFNRRNCNRLAAEYDAEITRWEPKNKHAMMKDRLGRILWMEGYGDVTE